MGRAQRTDAQTTHGSETTTNESRLYADHCALSLTTHAPGWFAWERAIARAAAARKQPAASHRKRRGGRGGGLPLGGGVVMVKGSGVLNE